MAGQISAYLGNFTELFALVGAGTASYIALKACLSLLKAFRVFVLSRTGQMAPYFRSHGEWAGKTCNRWMTLRTKLSPKSSLDAHFSLFLTRARTIS